MILIAHTVRIDFNKDTEAVRIRTGETGDAAL